MAKAKREKIYTLPQIIRAAEGASGLGLLGTEKWQTHTVWRTAAWIVAKEHDHGSVAIAKAFRRDHSTIGKVLKYVAGYDRVRAEAVRAAVQAIKAMLREKHLPVDSPYLRYARLATGRLMSDLEKFERGIDSKLEKFGRKQETLRGVDPRVLPVDGEEIGTSRATLVHSNDALLAALRRWHSDMETPDHNRVSVKQWRNYESRSAA